MKPIFSLSVLTSQYARGVTTFLTAPGQQGIVLLPDGSQVVLNVATKLDISPNFKSRDRNVSVFGEALFNVSHSTSAPFIVTAGGTTAQALGTSFIIRRYADDSLMTLSVVDGRVSVNDNVFSAHQQAAFADHDMVQLRTVDASMVTFVSGILPLNGEPLGTLMPVLNRWYGVVFKVMDPELNAIRLEGNLPMGSVSDLISLLEIVFDIRVVQHGSIVTLYSRK